jgi:membrane protein YqaA with SNARE-associated domain
MDFNLLHASTWRVRIAALAGSWKVCFLDYLLGVILRNRMRHLEAGQWHTDQALKREKQADRIGRRAAAVLASAGLVGRSSS